MTSGTNQKAQLKRGDAWGKCVDAYIKTSDAWNQVKRIWIKESSTWKIAHTHYACNLTDSTISSGIQGRIYIMADGTTEAWITEVGYGTQINDSTDWIIPNSASSEETFEASWTQVEGGGTDPMNQYTTGWTEGVWKDLTSDLYVGRTESPGVSFVAVEVTIRRKSDSMEMAKGRFDINIT